MSVLLPPALKFLRIYSKKMTPAEGKLSHLLLQFEEVVPANTSQKRPYKQKAEG